MNDNAVLATSPVPLIPLRRAEGIVAEIETLRRRADDEGQGTLAYLLECAEIEARYIADRERRNKAEREADPGDLWSPC